MSAARAGLRRTIICFALATFMIPIGPRRTLLRLAGDCRAIALLAAEKIAGFAQLVGLAF